MKSKKYYISNAIQNQGKDNLDNLATE